MINKVKNYIDMNHMIDKGDKIVVGVSGGADSVCLLHVFHELCADKAELFVVHVNHGIRGLEADADEQYVEALCNKLNIIFQVFHVDVRKIAKEQGFSEEEAGRKVRYEAFLEVCRIHQCNKIAIAHNKNDNAETVLFHLFRGSGTTGLSGIASIREIEAYDVKATIIRPLLCVSRKEIEQYMKDQKIVYQTDSTNLENDYSRNKIRNQVLAYVTEEINQNAVEHIAQAAVQLKEIDEYIQKEVSLSYNRLVEEANNIYCIKVQELLKEDVVIQKALLRKVMKNLGGNLKDLEAKHVNLVLTLINKPVGKSINLPYNMIAQREYSSIKLYINGENESEGESRNQSGDQGIKLPILLQIPGKHLIPMGQSILDVKLLDFKKNMTIPKNSCTKWFDYDKIENTVEIRTRRMGDYIQIDRAGGRKKLKDYFIDSKIPRDTRNNMLLIADGAHIMWILGDTNRERMSEKYKVDESTRKILVINRTDMEEE